MSEIQVKERELNPETAKILIDAGLLEKADNTLTLEAAGAGALSDIAKTEFMGVPIGSAAIGLLIVSAWDAIRGLIGGTIPTTIPQWIIPVVGAVVVQSRPVKGFLGKDAANAAGLILTADAIQALFNVRGLISGIVGGVKMGQVSPVGSVTSERSQGVDDYLRAQGLI